MTTFANSVAIQPAQGGEVACASIAGGPFAAVDGYVSGGTPGVQLEFRLYATVGALRTRVAVAPYAGPPVGAAGQGTLLKWTVIGQPQATSPVVAGGTAYDLVVYGVTGAGSRILATLAGTNAYDAAVAQSAAVALPSNYGSTAIVTNVGCAQLADVGVDQAGLPGNVTFDVLASCGAGSVEALVGTGGSGGTDGKSDVVRDLALPVATQYRLAVRETQGQRLSGNVTAALATYDSLVGGNITPAAITPGPQITSLRSVTPTVPSQVIWASTGYVDFVADCGADPTGVGDCGPAFIRAWALLSALAANPDLPKVTLKLFFPPGRYNVRTDPGVADFSVGGTSIEIYGCGNASVIECANPGGNIISITNAILSYLHDFACVGTQAAPTTDCNQAIFVSSRLTTKLENLSMQWILGAVSVITVAACDVEVDALNFGGCGTSSAINGVFYSNTIRGIEARHTVWMDTINLNGYNLPAGTKSLGTGPWYRQDDSAAIDKTQLVRFTDCFFDESTKQHIYIKGGPTARIPAVRIDGCQFNVPAFPGAAAAMSFENVDLVEIDGLINTGFTSDSNPPPTTPSLSFVSVLTANVNGFVVDPSAISNGITADAACGILSISNSPSLPPGNIASSARQTLIDGYITFQGIAAPGGDTFISDVPIALAYNARLRAIVTLTALDGSASASFEALYDVENIGGVLSAVPAIATSSNPFNSTALYTHMPQVTDASLLSGGGAPPTAVWTLSGTNARLTVANVSVTKAVRILVQVQAIFNPLAGSSFLPIDLGASLVGWYRSDAGVSVGATDTWKDLTANHYDLTQAVAGNQPTYVAAGGIHGLPVWRFPITLDRGFANAAFAALIFPFEVFVIYAPSASPPGNSFVTQFGAGLSGDIFIAGGDTHISLFSGVTLQGGLIPSFNTPHVVDAIFRGNAATSVALDRAAAVVGNAGANAPAGNGIVIGNVSALNSGAYGDLYEVIIFSAPLSAANRAKVMQYLQNRYSV